MNHCLDKLKYLLNKKRHGVHYFVNSGLVITTFSSKNFQRLENINHFTKIAKCLSFFYSNIFTKNV